MSANKIKVKQTGSLIGKPEAQRKVAIALGLGRIGKQREFTDTESIRGMIAKVHHLVEVTKA